MAGYVSSQRAKFAKCSGYIVRQFRLLIAPVNNVSYSDTVQLLDLLMCIAMWRFGVSCSGTVVMFV